MEALSLAPQLNSPPRLRPHLSVLLKTHGGFDKVTPGQHMMIDELEADKTRSKSRNTPRRMIEMG